MPDDVKRISNYLKALAEKRARAAGDLERYESVAAKARQQYEKAKAVVEACDVLIQEYDHRLEPGTIEAIHTWKNHPKRRGGLSKALVALVRAHSPDGITTEQITQALEVEWQLKFLVPADRAEWKRGSIGRRLRDLAKKGIVAAMHDQSAAATVDAGRWRLPGDPDPSLGHLKAQIEAAGGEVRLYGGGHA
jgi:hypothetical protein